MLNKFIALILAGSMGLSAMSAYASVGNLNVSILTQSQFQIQYVVTPNNSQTGAKWVTQPNCSGYKCSFSIQFLPVSNLSNDNYPVIIILAPQEQKDDTCTFYLNYNVQSQNISSANLTCSKSYYWEPGTLLNDGKSNVVMLIDDATTGGPV